MLLETLDDVHAWVQALQQGGATAVDNGELGQVLRLMGQALQTLTAQNAVHEARLAAHDEQLAALRAAYAAAEHADDDLDIFQAGYERGYAQGWQHALAAKEAPTP